MLEWLLHGFGHLSHQLEKNLENILKEKNGNNYGYSWEHMPLSGNVPIIDNFH
jgi:hypothetical protein